MNNFILSVVTISDELIGKVANSCSVSVEKVKEYLQSSQQDDALLAAFLFYGIGPFNKFFTSNSHNVIHNIAKESISMGTMVGQGYCPDCNRKGER